MNSRTPKVEIGDVMGDGSIFAGLTLDGTQKLFAMPADLGLVLTFNEAAKRVAQLNTDKTLGHDDWQIPTRDQLELLQNIPLFFARAGTFNTPSSKGTGSSFPDWYWSSTVNPDLSSYVWVVPFTDGYEGWHPKDGGRLSCRPVRVVPVNKPGSTP